MTRRNRVGLQVLACLAVGAAASVWQGQDGNWDLLNYHLYNVFWLLEGRKHFDFVANGLHNFLSPLPDIPFYLLATKWLPTFPRTVTAIQGLYFGALIYVVLKINERVLPRAGGFTFAQAAIATAIGTTGAATLPEAGTTYNDIQVALLVLSGVLILLPLLAENAHVRVTARSTLAGVLCGAAAGVKLTALLYAPGVVLALLPVLPWRRSFAIAALFCVGWALGFGVAYGWWGWLLWDMTGNPFFPFYNRFFRSDWWPPQNFAPHYPIKSWVSLITYPFYWIRSQKELVTELPFRDARFAAALLSIGFLVLLGLLRLRTSSRADAGRDADPAQARYRDFLIVFFVVSYAIWLPVSIALRYAVTIEVLTGTMMLLAAGAFVGLLPATRLRNAATPILGLLGLTVFLLHTVYPAWARREYGPQVFSIRVPDMPAGSLIIVHGAPLAYLLPFVTSPGWSAVGVSNFTYPGYRIYDLTKQRISSHTGPMFVLYVHLETPWFRSLIAELGAVWETDRCRPVESNMSWGLSLCDARRP